MDQKKIKGIILFALLGVSAFSAFFLLDKKPMGNHEAYVAVSARQMLNSGQWVIPYFNGQPRLQKTPLCYWILAAIGKISGEINDFNTRLPSALFAILAAAAIFYFVKEHSGFRAAVLSAFIWATSLGYIRYSHSGRPEMTLCSFVAIAMLSFYAGIKTESRKKQICFMLVFWISFALAMLAKGPAPLPLIAPALFLYFLFFRKWKLVPKVLPIAGIIIFLLIVLPWPIAVLKHLSAAADVWNKEFLARAEGEYAAGTNPFYYYFKVMFVYIAPYSALIPLAFFAPFYKIWEEKRDALWYHWFWFFAGIIAMTACGGKRQHYILPLMPAMAVMGGIILEDMIFIRKSYDFKFVRNFAFGHVIAILIGAGILIFSVQKNRDADFDDDWASQKIASLINRDFPYTQVIAYCKMNASFIYYLGKDAPQICDINDVYAHYKNGFGVYALDGEYEQMKNDDRFNLVIESSDDERGFFLKTE